MKGTDNIRLDVPSFRRTNGDQLEGVPGVRIFTQQDILSIWLFYLS
jgi:hypothetical protein